VLARPAAVRFVFGILEATDKRNVVEVDSEVSSGNSLLVKAHRTSELNSAKSGQTPSRANGAHVTRPKTESNTVPVKAKP